MDGQPQRARMGKAGEMSHGGLVAFNLAGSDFDFDFPQYLELC